MFVFPGFSVETFRASNWNRESLWRSGQQWLGSFSFILLRKLTAVKVHIPTYLWWISWEFWNECFDVVTKKSSKLEVTRQFGWDSTKRSKIEINKRHPASHCPKWEIEWRTLKIFQEAPKSKHQNLVLRLHQGVLVCDGWLCRIAALMFLPRLNKTQDLNLGPPCVRIATMPISQNKSSSTTNVIRIDHKGPMFPWFSPTILSLSHFTSTIR